ncbi:MAG TPA: tetratricopeptide repeat protein, partial [Thermoanaerobaculia bacterium]|nr:tetratricopeptide repeat protein [Thermoanaerobaculia bacterium]
MLPLPGERRLYEFGEFRVDPVRRRLLRDGEPVAVTSKAFSLLVILLERRGQVVDKEELFRLVWPDTYVTEANLTQNVSSLRKALGERAGDRRYIVTVPGRGYCFAAEVMEVPSDASGAFPIPRLEDLRPVRAEPAEALETDGESWAAPEASAAPVTPVAPGALPRRLRRPGIALLGAAALLALGALSLLLVSPGGLSRPRSQPAAPVAANLRPSVAVLGFRNAGNPKTAQETAWLGVALSEMLSTELSAGGQARLIPGENVTQARQSLAIPSTSDLRRPDLAQLRARLHTILGADLVVAGSYVVLDLPGGRRQIRLDLRAMRLPDGTEVAALSEAGGESELFEIVSRAGARLRQALGLEPLSPGQVQAVQALHPAVPEAARLTAEGVARLRAYDPMKARDLLVRAAAIEPGSATIHSFLARAWYDVGDDVRSLQEARRARELSGSLPRQERLAIEARFYAAGKQWLQAAEVYRSLWTFFPDDIDHGLQLSTALINAGQCAEALKVLAALQQLPAGRDDPRIDLEESRAAYRLSDLSTQARAAASAEAKARRLGERLALARALVMQGMALVDMGKPQDAVPRFREAERLARVVGHPWTAGMALSNLGLALQALGEFDEAELRHEQSLAIARQLGAGIGIASQLRALARLHQDRGDLAEALHLLDEAQGAYVGIGDRLMEGTVRAGMAQILLQQGETGAAQRSAEEAVTAAREVGNRGEEARALEALASILTWQGEIAGSRRHLDAALHLLMRSRHPVLAVTTLVASSEVLARQGDMDLARRRIEQAIVVNQRAGDKRASALLFGARSRLALRMGNVAEARTMDEALLLLSRQT